MTPTRETFGNISSRSQAAFYLLAGLAVAVFAWGTWRRFRLWRQGQPVPVRELFRGNLAAIVARIRPGLRRLFTDGLLQRRVAGRGAAGRAHILLFVGFMTLLAGTTLLELDHLLAMISHELSFHHGAYYVVYEFTLDILGVAFLAGCIYFLIRRARRPASLGHRPGDWAVLWGFLAIGLTGYLVEALRLTWQHPQGIAAHCSPVGWGLAQLFQGLSETSARRAHWAGWWLHALLVFGFFAAIPFTRLFHFVAGPFNLFLAPATLGELAPVPLEEVERTGRVGVIEIRHFTQQQLLSLDACMECGRCEDACPAFATAKPLSPKKIVQDLRREMETALRTPAIAPEPLVGRVIEPETLLACTTCHACVGVCPVRIDQLGLILDLRRQLVAEGGLSGTAATALRRLQSASNPWGLPPADRAAWRDSLPA